MGRRSSPRFSRLVCGVVLVGLWLPGFARAAGEIAIIASRDWEAAQDISLPELRRVYLGRVTRLFGRRVERFHLRSGSTARRAFRLAVLARTEASLEDYWVEQALRGGPLPPRELSTAAQVVRAVSQGASALGYVGYAELSSQDASGVRILTVRTSNGSFRPPDPAYPIRAPEVEP